MFSNISESSTPPHPRKLIKIFDKESLNMTAVKFRKKCFKNSLIKIARVAKMYRVKVDLHFNHAHLLNFKLIIYYI